MTTRSEAENKALEIMGLNKKEIVLMTKFSPVPFSDEILSKIKIVFDKHKNLWRYDSQEGVWKSNAEQFLRTLIRNQLLGDEQQKRNYVEEIISHIKDVTFDDNFSIDDDPFLIGFKNGVFDLKDNQFKNFSQEFKLTNKLNIEIDENIKECPVIDKFFSDCIGGEFKDILYDLFAYCLFRRYPYPKMFFIYGPANTGKSKVMELLEKFLGEENRCSIEPQDIQKDMYASSQMLFKMANIVSDINYDALENISQVKKITGEDSIKIRNMYKEPYNARVFAKQIFSTNKLPIVKEKTKAWYKRIYLIEFSNIVTPEKEDPFLMTKLTNSNELKGLAYKCLEHLKELRDNNFVFTYDIDKNAIEQIYEQLSNPILMFIEQSCVRGEGNYLYQFEFKDRLKSWLQGNHFPPISKSETNDYMRDNFVESNRESIDKLKVYRVWSGLRWKLSDESTTINQFNHFNQVSKKVYIYRKYFQNPVKSVNSVKQELREPSQ